jgi:serine phosphatase RsbU (regulator of sigma subunit)
MKHEILETVRMHIEQQANEDDQTLVVLKWRGGETGTQVFS